MLLVLLVLLSGTLGEARRHAPLIHPEDHPRRPSKAAECQFGKQVRELGSTWFADLGPPFGVMHCIRCECIPVQKKRRVVGKVHCRNIKHECPKPTCEEPVLLAGRCCKVCPGEIQSPDLVQDVVPMVSLEEDDKNSKYYAALLTGRTTHVTVEGSTVGGSKDYTATGRFTFHRRSLYYSFYSTQRPRSIQFLDMKGNILEEQVLPPYSVYQNATGKVCGVWRRIPREYRRLIREQKLVVSLLWERADLSISGQLYRYSTLATEMYSSLLEGGTPGSGGTVIVSICTTAPSIHVTVIFNGIFLPNETSDIPLTLKLHSHDKQHLVMDEIIRVEKPSSELNIIEARSAVSSNDLRMLARNRLSLTLSSRSKPDLKLTGRVTVRTTCELYQALLSQPTESPAPAGDQEAAGLAWMYIDSEGALRYHVKIEKVSEPFVVSLVVERRVLELEDLSPQVKDGWANGTLDRLSLKHLEQLYNGELGVNVATRTSHSVVRGRLTQRAAAEPRDTPQGPSLLRPVSPNQTQRMTGMAWTSVDIECNLHYEVQLYGANIDGGEYQLYQLEVPVVAPGAPENRRLLENFSGAYLEGSSLALLPNELAWIESGMVHLEVYNVRTGSTILTAEWGKVYVPSSCLPHYSDNDVPLGFNSDSSSSNSGSQSSSATGERTGSCYHGGRYHEEGTQWRSATDSCVVCHCGVDRISCEPLVCPAPPPGCHSLPGNAVQCCQHSCKNNSIEQVSLPEKGCVMAGQLFPPGASWHPYLPPKGFDTCIVCTCNPITLKLSCPRIVCPPLLGCEEFQAIKLDRKSCCKVCPTAENTALATSAPALPPLVMGTQGDQANNKDEDSIPTETEILAAGGCRYPVGGPFRNGQDWHPKIYAHAPVEIKCVKCRCKDGKVKCDRKRCTKWSCSDECCSAQCAQRNRRHAFKRHWTF